MFKVEFATDNAAFEDVNSEVARILRDLADKVDSGTRTDGRVMDYNGNAVGKWSLDS